MNQWVGKRKVYKKVMKIIERVEQYKFKNESWFKENESRIIQNWQNEDSENHLIELLALLRDRSIKVLKLNPYNEQLIGALILWDGKLAEMKTGEGKSLTVALASVIGALRGIRVHVVTVNEYLAQRDAYEFEPFFNSFGLSRGLVLESLNDEDKMSEHQKEIVYAVNHEFGFEYLRGNMIKNIKDRKMDRMEWCIIDEVDSILIDEARTPLIISGVQEDDLSQYEFLTEWAKRLEKNDIEVDRKDKKVLLTDSGYSKLEKMAIEKGWINDGAGIYKIEQEGLMQKVNAVLYSLWLMEEGKEYVIKNGKIIIVDENTGRLMEDRRWSNGIHQAVEQKEGVTVQQETKVMASITYQNLFKKYKKLSGLTGTAKTQEEEFQLIYGLDVIEVPTHKKTIRKDYSDIIYKTKEAKWSAIGTLVKEKVKKNQPVLIGTPNVWESEKISDTLRKIGVEHCVLNAKNHEKEALIIEQAGEPGRVTVATNMAGRGTDILLGGNWKGLFDRWRAEYEAKSWTEILERKKGEEVTIEDWNVWRQESLSIIDEKRREFMKKWEIDNQLVKDCGGLVVIGTARNDSRRIDNQLRGRAGRQGDPGESHMLVSLDDDLFVVYAQDKIRKWLDTMGLMEGNDVLNHPMLTKAMNRAQQTVENLFFNARKQLMDFDDVGAKQRDIVYELRDLVLNAKMEQWEMWLKEWGEEVLLDEIRNRGWILSEEEPSSESQKEIFDHWGWNLKKINFEEWEGWEKNIKLFLEEKWKEIEKNVTLESNQAKIHKTLGIIDEGWQRQMEGLKHLLEGIHLRSYAQKTPKWEYKREGFEMFNWFIHEMKKRVIALWLKDFEINEWEPIIEGVLIEEEEIRK